MQSEITETGTGSCIGSAAFFEAGNPIVSKNHQDAISVLRDQESPILFILRTTVDWLIPM